MTAVAFRVVAPTHVGANNRGQIWRSDRRDAPWDAGRFHALELKESSLVPYQQGAAANGSFSDSRDRALPYLKAGHF